jgi:hypothetical protein
MVHVQGIKHKVADALSHHSSGTNNPEAMTIPDATIEKQLLSSAIKSTHSMAVTWDRVKTATVSDTTMEKLLSTSTVDFPEFRHELPPDLQEFFQFREHLYAIDGVILYKARIVIFSSLRSHILSILHSAHQGITSMTSCAKATVVWAYFWPGITPAIRAIREPCQHCNRMAPSQPNPLPHPSLHQATHFNSYALITPITKVSITSWS